MAKVQIWPLAREGRIEMQFEASIEHRGRILEPVTIYATVNGEHRDLRIRQIACEQEVLAAFDSNDRSVAVDPFPGCTCNEKTGLHGPGCAISGWIGDVKEKARDTSERAPIQRHGIDDYAAQVRESNERALPTDTEGIVAWRKRRGSDQRSDEK